MKLGEYCRGISLPVKLTKTIKPNFSSLRTILLWKNLGLSHSSLEGAPPLTLPFCQWLILDAQYHQAEELVYSQG